jgi:hypothetical protein
MTEVIQAIPLKRMQARRCLPPFHLRKVADSVSKIFFSVVEYQMMNKIQKFTNPKCYTPSPESFRIDCYFLFDRGSSVDIPALNEQ